MCDGLMMEHGECKIQNDEYELPEPVHKKLEQSVELTAGCGKCNPIKLINEQFFN